MPLKMRIIPTLCVADLEKEQMTYRGGGSLACEEADWPRAASGFFPIGWAASGCLPIGWADGPATVRISEAASFHFLLITMSDVAVTAGSKETAVRPGWKWQAVKQLESSFHNGGSLLPLETGLETGGRCWQRGVGQLLALEAGMELRGNR